MTRKSLNCQNIKKFDFGGEVESLHVAKASLSFHKSQVLPKSNFSTNLQLIFDSVTNKRVKKFPDNYCLTNSWNL